MRVEQVAQRAKECGVGGAALSALQPLSGELRVEEKLWSDSTIVLLFRTKNAQVRRVLLMNSGSTWSVLVNDIELPEEDAKPAVEVPFVTPMTYHGVHWTHLDPQYTRKIGSTEEFTPKSDPIEPELASPRFPNGNQPSLEGQLALFGKGRS